MINIIIKKFMITFMKKMIKITLKITSSNCQSINKINNYLNIEIENKISENNIK